MVAISPLLTLAGVLATCAYAQNSTIEGCSMFKVNGTWQEYFQFYRFYDFEYANPSNTRISTSSWPNNRDNETELEIFKRYTDATWTEDWSVRTANKAPANDKLIPLDYVRENVYMGNLNGRGLLTLNTSMLSNNTQLGGEMFWRPADVDAVSMRVSARVTGDSGAVAGIFTYHNDTQESDIEILTRDMGSSVHLTNQPTLDSHDQPIADSTFNQSMPWFKTVDDFSVYRLDWFPNLGVSAWYVDGSLLKSSEVNVPFEASTLMIDMWSNGGSWSGDMQIWGQAKLEIQWIEIAFNASTLERTGVPKNGVVCQIDPLGDNNGQQRDDDPNGFTEPTGLAGSGSSKDSGSAAVVPKSLGSCVAALATSSFLVFLSL
ncbi:hypothetical protein NLU13_5380 [Sarocladium strictum]|uniref:GH16 domain-containing protein n=1 Tax=Sarocladium strictum TaxID=5046 RepID=A0AA39GGS3_SARSR|nr:hypothetical protein NLU13_5380 [Sarocladium strictum]